MTRVRDLLAILGAEEYVIAGPLLGDALATMRAGGHVHIVNEADPTDRMCSGRRACPGYDRIQLEEKSSAAGLASTAAGCYRRRVRRAAISASMTRPVRRSKGADMTSAGFANGGFQQDAACPVGPSRGADLFPLGWGEPDLHGEGSALLVGERWPSGSRVHRVSLAGYRKFGKVLDAMTSEGHNKDMTKQEIFNKDYDRLAAAVMETGGVVTCGDGFQYIDEAICPPSLLRAYNGLIEYGYANGLLK